MEANTKPEQVPYNDRNTAAMSYVWIMSVLVYFSQKKNPYVRFHASQASALFILSIIFWFIPVINTGLEAFVGIFMIMGFIKASQGEYFQLPFIGQLVFSQNPFKTALVKTGGSLKYLSIWLKSKVVHNKEVQAQLQKAKQEILGSSSQFGVSIAPVADGKRNNNAAALAYVWILSIVIFVSNPDNEYVKFHARQGVVLFALSCVFATVPVIGFYLNVLILLLSVLGFIMAFSGEQYRIPVAGQIAENNPSFEAFYLHVKASLLYLSHMWKSSLEKGKNLSYAEILEEATANYNRKKEIHEPEEQDSKDIAAASYVFLGPLIWLLHRKNPFVRFHARQATVLLLFVLVLFFLEPVRYLALLLVGMMLLGFLMALKSEYYPMPFVFDMLHSQIGPKEIVVSVFKGIGSLLKFLKRLVSAEPGPAKPEQPAVPPQPPQ